MKCRVYVLFAAIILSACDGGTKPEAAALATRISDAANEHSPGAVGTSKNGFFMSADIDGKRWEASEMIPDESVNSNSKMIVGKDEDYSINFQVYMPGIRSGTKRKFTSDHAVSLTPKAGDTGFWSGLTGDMEITNVNERFMEGKFQFTATSSSSEKKIEVTNGYFRVLLEGSGQ